MLKYIILFFGLTLILTSCKPAGPNQTIIDKEKMVRLLTDLHIVDGGMYNVMAVNPDTLYKFGTARYLALFKKYGVDSTTFRRSLKYYTGKPIELEGMYDEVLKNLTAKTDSANNTLLKKNNGQRPKAY